MQYRMLGNTGMKVSEIGFGGWAIGGSWGQQNDEESILALNKAIDEGVNIIDTAAGYGDGKSEKIIAEVLKSRNEKIFLCTKTPPTSGNWPPSPYDSAEKRYPEKYLYQNIEERLRNLNTNSLDILLLHTWTRAWNKDPKPLKILRKMQSEGLIKFIGVSTPEHDQNSLIDLMRNGYVDVVQVIYNIFEQEPAAEFLPIAKEYKVGVMVRVAFDEGVLTGKFNEYTQFPPDDFRSRYFEGDRIVRAVNRAEKIKNDMANTSLSMPQIALKFPLSHAGVSTVIAGIRNPLQAEMNCSISDLPALNEEIIERLHQHAWNRGLWYAGK